MTNTNPKFKVVGGDIICDSPELQVLTEVTSARIKSWVEGRYGRVTNVNFLEDIANSWSEAFPGFIGEYLQNFTISNTTEDLLFLLSREDTKDFTFGFKLQFDDNSRDFKVYGSPATLLKEHVSEYGAELVNPNLVRFVFNQTQSGYGEDFNSLYSIYKNISEDDIEKLAYNASRSAEKIGEDAFESGLFIGQ